jgi:hypothetical protein
MRLTRAKFTVRRLMALVLASAVVITFVRLVAAAWGPDEVLLILACLCAITAPPTFSRPGRGRSIAAGWALGGGIYLLLNLGFAIGPDQVDLPTTRLLDGLCHRVDDPMLAPGNAVRGYCGTDIVQRRALRREREARESAERFRVGLCLMAMIAAGVGGLGGFVLDPWARRILSGLRGRGRTTLR